MIYFSLNNFVRSKVRYNTFAGLIIVTYVSFQLFVVVHDFDDARMRVYVCKYINVSVSEAGLVSAICCCPLA